MHPEGIKICDTTLRDGEQMPGVVFSSEEKIELAEKSSEFGSDIIEIMPVVSKSEQKLTRELVELGLKSKITASTMLKKSHIDIALNCGVDNVTLFTPVSDIHLSAKLKTTREKNLEKALEMVDYCREHGLEVNFAGEDATRADLDYLISFIKSVEKKISYFLPCDTLGCLTPEKTEKFIKTLSRKCSSPLALHIHNDFAMSTANTLAGLDAGATIFSGTFGGIGERAGNAPIEEVVVGLKYLFGTVLEVRYKMLGDICRLVERYSGVKFQPHKPLTGENAFAHESGVHTDGMLKDTRTYENFNPGEMGMERKFLLGKHSGKAIIRHLFGDKISESRYDELLNRIKVRAENEKRSLVPEEILKRSM